MRSFGVLALLLIIPSPGQAQRFVEVDGSCARTDDGHVYCTGYQMGRVDDLVMLDIDGIRQISGGCGIRGQGEVWCWREGTPTQVQGVSDAVHLDPPCLVHRTGRATCGVPGRLYPVEGIEDALRIAEGENHKCFVLREGRVGCVGSNGWGQLGRRGQRSGPVDMAGPRVEGMVIVPGIDDAVDVVAGSEHSCALHGSGEVSCWGSDDSGALGDGAGHVHPGDPTQVRGVVDAVQLSSTSYGVCARLRNGQVICWGGHGYSIDGQRRLSYNTTGISRTVSPTYQAPTAVHDLGLAVDLSAGRERICVARRDGTLACIGSYTRFQPTQVPGLSHVTEIDANEHTACALDQHGSVWCWGTVHGVDQLSPVRVDIQAARSIAVGGSWMMVCAVLEGGGVRCLPAGVDQAPVDVPLQNARSLELGSVHGCALLQDGGVACWGRGNDYGCRGDQGEGPLEMPARVDGVSGAVALGLSSNSSCAALRDGPVLCWGERLEEDSEISRSERFGPLPLSSLRNIVDLDGTSGHMVAVASLGRVSFWGFHLSFPNERRQGGRLSVGEFQEIRGARSISVGRGHQCFLLRDGRVQCWGGFYPYAPSGSVNVTTISGINDAMDVAAGDGFACALRRDGRVFCWGSDNHGELGLGYGPGHVGPFAR